MNPLMLWNIIEWCAKDAYVGGETFLSDTGHEIYFDGQRLVGIEQADIKSTWHYVENKKVV